MLERLDALVASMGNLATKLDTLISVCEGQAKMEPVKEEVVEPEEKPEENEHVKPEEKPEEKSELTDEEKEELEKEEEQKEYEKGLNSLREKYSEKCKALGINIEDLISENE